MGRPSKKYVDYFPHDSDASDRQTLFILESNFGNDGYAFWFKLLEILARKNGHFIDLRNGNELLFLSAKTHIPTEKTELILNLLDKLGAIDSDLWSKRIIWSQNFIERIRDAYRNRKELLPEKPVINDVSDVRNLVYSVESAQSKLKEIKEKEIKGKTLVQLNSFFEQFWSVYPRHHGKTPALKAFTKIKNLESKIEVILKGLKIACQSEQWLKDNGKYIPMPATWINQERWTDEYRDKKETESNPYSD